MASKKVGRPTKADYDAVAGDFAKVFGDVESAYREARRADTGENAPPGLASGAALRLEGVDQHGRPRVEALPMTPAGRLAYETELRQMLAEAKPRTLLTRLRDAWAGMVAGWRGEVGE